MSETVLALVGQNRLFLQGLRNLLPETQYDVSVEAASINELEAAYARRNQDGGEDAPRDAGVIMIDLPNDLDLIVQNVTRVRELFPKTAIIILTDSLCPRCLSASLAAGADAYLLKSISIEALLHSIELVLLGEKVLPTKLAGLLVNGITDIAPADSKTLSSIGLSYRETQILACLVAGNSNKVIANRLAITEATVKVHMKSLLRKIKVDNRTQAAIWAVNHGVAPPTPTVAVS